MSAMITAFDRGQPVTVVAFSGLAPKNSMFEWVKSFADLPCNFLGVRDATNDWYQTHRDYVANEVGSACPGTKRLFIGASAGGFAALMFGKQLGADAVLAFEPQSACGETKERLGDKRWPDFPAPDCDIAGKHPNAVIYYAVDEELDVMHAHRLDARCEAYPVGGHKLSGRLKERGLLADLLKTALRGLA